MQILILLGISLMAFYGFLLWRNNSSSIKLNHYKLLENKSIEKITQLPEQGHCNVNYLVKTKQQNYLLRKFKHDFNRKKEFYLQNKAHKKNIAAKALLLDETNNLMICDFIDGSHPKKLNQQTLKKLALLLQKLHQIKVPVPAYTFRNNFKLQDKKVLAAFKVVNTFKPEYVFSHNDLHPKNILFAKKIQFIDWEYAGKSDRYFDLAAIIIEFKLNKKDERTFLFTYFGRKESANKKKLEAFKVIYTTLWTVLFGRLERGKLAES